MTGAVRIMGVLNVTPDSFSDGGCWTARDAALRHVEGMIAGGADIIDVGGESTRPGAVRPGLQEEMDRVLPVVEAIREHHDVQVSVDTSSPTLMRAAVAAGAGMINDVRALQRDGALQTAASLDVPVCLMHMQGEPGTMQQEPRYDDVLEDVKSFLRGRMDAALQAGVRQEHLIVDPGFGFGKMLEHNLLLLRHLARFAELGVPLLVGISRKSMLGAITGREVDERLPGSLACALIAAMAGATIIRVHDVPETADVLRVLSAVTAAE